MLTKNAYLASGRFSGEEGASNGDVFFGDTHSTGWARGTEQRTSLLVPGKLFLSHWDWEACYCYLEPQYYLAFPVKICKECNGSS